MRRERSGLRSVHGVLAVLLLVPPGIRIAFHLERIGTESTTDSAVEDALQTLRDAALDELERLEPEWRLPGVNDPLGRYTPVPADVLPLGDPSARRSLLWGLARGTAPVPADTAAVHRGALAGRVVRCFASLGVVKVQTLLDPGFRVRFHHPGASGLLCGTGRLHEESPILEVKYVDGMQQLQEGDPVHTEGQDGVYPPSLLIGHVTRASDCGGHPDESRMVVRAAVRTAEAMRLLLAVDNGRDLVIQAQRTEKREENGETGQKEGGS